MKAKLFSLSCMILFAFLTGCNSVPKPHKNDGKINRRVDSLKTNTYFITYDFQTGKYETNNLAPKVNNPVVYKIININRMAYNVAISCKDSVLAESNVPEGFLLFNPDKDEAKNDEGEEGAASAPQVQPKTVTSSDTNEKFKQALGISPDDKEDKLRKFNNAIVSSNVINNELAGLKAKKFNLQSEKKRLLSGKKSKEDSIQAYVTVTDTSKKLVTEKTIAKLRLQNDSINKRLEALKKNIDDKDALIKDKSKELEEAEIKEKALALFIKENNQIQATFAKFRRSFDKIRRLKMHYSDLCNTINDPLLTFEKYQKIKPKFEGIWTEMTELSVEIDSLTNHYYQLEREHIQMKNNYQLNEAFNENGRQKLYAGADKIKEYSNNMYESVRKSNPKKIIKHVQQAISLLQDKETYEIVSKPIQPIYDVVIFDVDIKKKYKDTDVDALHNERKFNHKEFTYSGMRLDVSLGLSASYFDDTPTYELGKDHNGDVAILRDEKHLFVPSFLGLFTASYRNSRQVTIGGSVGLGLDATNGKIQLNNFFAGPTLIWGKHERISLTSGVTLRTIQKLDGGYNVGDNVPNATDISDYTKDAYKLGFFIAVTYNLTNGVKKQIRYFKK